jgi:hypothetical protein
MSRNEKLPWEVMRGGWLWDQSSDKVKDPERDGDVSGPGIRTRRPAMTLSSEGQLRDRFFKVLLEASLPLQPGSDAEVTLEALIDAAGMLKEHLQRELVELRQEQVE